MSKERPHSNNAIRYLDRDLFIYKKSKEKLFGLNIIFYILYKIILST